MVKCFNWIPINLYAKFVKIQTAVPMLGPPPEQNSPGQMFFRQVKSSDVTWVNGRRIPTILYDTCGPEAIISFKFVDI